MAQRRIKQPSDTKRDDRPDANDFRPDDPSGIAGDPTRGEQRTASGGSNHRKPTGGDTVAPTEKEPEAPGTLVIEEQNADPVKRRKKRAVSTARKTEAKTAAAVMVETASTFGESLLGPSGAFTPLERELIESPLARILSKTDPKKLGQFAEIIDPLLLLVGIGLYAQRVQKVLVPQAPTKPAPAPLSQILRATPDTDPSLPPTLRQSLKPEGGAG